MKTRRDTMIMMGSSGETDYGGERHGDTTGPIDALHRICLLEILLTASCVNGREKQWLLSMQTSNSQRLSYCKEVQIWRNSGVLAGERASPQIPIARRGSSSDVEPKIAAPSRSA